MMRRVTAIVSAAAVALWAVGAFAGQAPPSFAGKWTPDASAAAPAAAAPAGGGAGAGGRGGGRGGRGGAGWGMEFTIVQDASTLTVDYMAGGQNPTAQKFVVKLDGSDSTNTAGGRGGPTEQVSKATWSGQALTITTATPNGEQKRVLELDGAKLKITVTNPGFQGGDPVTTTVTYNKS